MQESNFSHWNFSGRPPSYPALILAMFINFCSGSRSTLATSKPWKRCGAFPDSDLPIRVPLCILLHHCIPFPYSPLLPSTPIATAAGVAAASQQGLDGPGRAGPGRAGCSALFATSPQLHCQAASPPGLDCGLVLCPPSCAEEQDPGGRRRAPRAGAAPRNRLKFTFGLLIGVQEPEKVCSQFTFSLQTVVKSLHCYQKSLHQRLRNSKKSLH